MLELFFSQKTRMRKSWERNDIFYVVDTKNALQISLKSQSKAAMRDRAKTPQVQIPAKFTSVFRLLLMSIKIS